MIDLEFTCPTCDERMLGTVAKEHLHKHEEETGEMTIAVYNFLEDPESVLDNIKRVIDAVRKGNTTGAISIKIQR